MIKRMNRYFYSRLPYDCTSCANSSSYAPTSNEKYLVPSRQVPEILLRLPIVHTCTRMLDYPCSKCTYIFEQPRDDFDSGDIQDSRALSTQTEEDVRNRWSAALHARFGR